MTYRSVKSPTLFKLLDDSHWPADLRRYRGQLKPHAGAPLWLIINDGELVDQQSGLSRWREAVLPQLQALLR